MQVQAGIRDTWTKAASFKFALDNISFWMFLLLLGLLVPVGSATLDGFGDITDADGTFTRTFLVLAVLSSAAWVLALLGHAIIVVPKVRQKVAEERHGSHFLKLILAILLLCIPCMLGIALVPLELYWIWTRLIAPSVEDAPKPADIECAALVWQIALLVMELQEFAATLLKQRRPESQSPMVAVYHMLGRLKNGLTAHFASGWNWIEAMAFACVLIALVWRQCIFRSRDLIADHPGVNELLTVGILLSWIRVLRAMEVSSRLGPLLSMVSPLPSSRLPLAPHRCQSLGHRLRRCCIKTSSDSW